MNINPLSANLMNIISPGSAIGGIVDNNTSAGQSDASFSSILTDALNAASELDLADRASGLELLTGQSDDLSGLMLDAQKAELSLNLALQIRNRIMDSYNEVMRMQV